MKTKKTLYTFYSEIYYKDKDVFKTNLGTLRLDRYYFSFHIGDFTQIYVTEMKRFPYPKVKK